MTKPLRLILAILASAGLAPAQESAPASVPSGAPPGMVLVPGGKHRIGINAADEDAIAIAMGALPPIAHASSPAHEVELADFFFDVDEVTNECFDAYLRDTGRAAPKLWRSKERMPRAPVTGITHDDADSFLAWCGKRLPSELEWEAAARWRPPGDQTNRWWPWGDEYPRPEPRTGSPGPAGSSPHDVSALGIRDLGGNALEMTSSWFFPYPGAQHGPTFSGSLGVLRGGSSMGPPVYRMTTSRRPMTFKAAELIGFRGARSRVRGKDLFESVAGQGELRTQLEALGAPIRDEASGRPELALQDSTRFSALMAGGWDAASRMPSRARFVGVICRKTSAFADAAALVELAKDRGGQVMLGLFVTDVDFGSPPLPAGRYWVLFAPEAGKSPGGASGIVLEDVTQPGRRIVLPDSRVFVRGNEKRPTTLTVDQAKSNLSVLMTFPSARDEPRLAIELRLGATAGSLAMFQ